MKINLIFHIYCTEHKMTYYAIEKLKDNIDIFSIGAPSYTDNEYFAFDVLMAASLSNKNNNDKNSNK